MSDVFITYVLDRSGSMDSIWDQTISSFNEYKNDQARQDGTAYMTLVAFDSHYGNGPNIETIFDAEDARNIPDLNPRGAIQPRGMTPLHDAIGVGIREAEEWLETKARGRDFGGKVLFVINTDGYENSSKEFTKYTIQRKIKQKEQEGWTFLFMGAGIDAFHEAAQYGIKHAVPYAATAGAAMHTNSVLSRSTTTLRTNSDQTFKWEDDENEED